MKNLKEKMNNKGFSLVELLVVVAIMVVLVGVIAPSLLGNIEKSKESKDIQTLDSIASACQGAMADAKGFDAATKTAAYAAGVDIATLLKTGTADDFNTLVREYFPNRDTITLESKSGATGTITIVVSPTTNQVTVSVKKDRKSVV